MASNATAGAGPPMMPDPATLPHDSRVPNIWAASIVTWLISVVFVGARFYTRWFINRILGPTDWVLLLSLILTAGLCATEIIQAQYGLGKHVWDQAPPTPEAQTASMEVNWISIVFYGFSLFSLKISILLLYDAVFRVTKMRVAVYAVAAIVLVTNVWQFYVIFSACTPLQAFWDKSVVPVSCHPQSYWLSNNYLHIATDFLIFLIPIPAVWNLHAGRKQKGVLMGLFALGFFVCFISILRITLMTPILANPGPDPTYALATISLWTVVEVNLAIWCASIMTLKPFVNHFFPGLLSSKGSSGRSGDKQGSGSQRPSGGRQLTIGSGPARKLGSSGRDGWPDDVDDHGRGGKDDVEMGVRDWSPRSASGNSGSLKDFESQTSLAQQSVSTRGYVR